MSESVSDALWWALDSTRIPLPATPRICLLEATVDAAAPARARGWPLTCVQAQRPAVDALQAAGFDVVDEAASALSSADLILLPAPRARAYSRALLAQACIVAPPDAVLLAAAANAEGGRSLQSDVAALLPAMHTAAKHKCRIAWARTGNHSAALAASWSKAGEPYQRADGLWTQAGVFSADATDSASALLCAHLPVGLGARVADFGAGIGVLARHLALQASGLQSLGVYESDARALAMARRNLSCIQADAHFHWADLTQGVSERFDSVVMNPPFHAQGRTGLPQLGRRFVEVAAEALQPQGQLRMVANSHLPYEDVLAARFGEVERVVQRGGFKVIRAARPRRA